MPLSPLPIDQEIPNILQALTIHKNLVLIAAPGAGKTTRLPPALLPTTDKKILVLQPRRVAALAAASRIAEENQWTLAQEVGYQVRFDNCVSKQTRLIFITEALLSRKLMQDPELSDVGIVILDEFHERSIHTDLALGLLMELQQLSRPDLKIVVMSATIQPEPIQKFLGDAPLIEVPGKIYPLEIHYLPESQLLITHHAFYDRVVGCLKKFAPVSTGDVLVFLPGVGEIKRVHEHLEEWAQSKQFSVLSLYGSMPLSEQKKVLHKSSSKKIILATNVAESALTIDGVSTVVDSGLAKSVSMSLSTGLPKMQMTRVSKASATQRAGRSARQGPGKVYKLWNKQDELSMPDYEMAEIHRTDLCESLLFLARVGITDFSQFSWFESPQPRRLQLARTQLQNWGALSKDGHITDIGKKMSQMPLHPRLARVMIEAENLSVIPFASELCAILSEKDFLHDKNLSPGPSDLLLRWEIFDQSRQKPSFRSWLQLSQQIADSLPKKEQRQFDASKILPQLLLEAYSDLLCRKRSPQDSRAVKVDGSGVRLSEHSIVKDSEFFVALNMMESSSGAETSIRWASDIPKSLIEAKYSSQFHDVQSISFDEKTQRLTKLVTKKFHQLPLEDARVHPLTESELQQHLPEIALAKWDELLRTNQELKKWLERYHWYCNKTGLEEFSPAQKISALTEASLGEKNFSSLMNKDLNFFFERQLEPSTLRIFSKACPAHIQVPSGSQIPIQYFPDKDPVIEIRLQEVFGWSETPRILDGKVAITLHLLAPNYRPVQVTQDLSHFWKSAYLEVRKELRARYPKHSWPDDPLTAPAVAKGRQRR
jgi:ATP-dependent helicase HrpB